MSEPVDTVDEGELFSASKSRWAARAGCMRGWARRRRARKMTLRQPRGLAIAGPYCRHASGVLHVGRGENLENIFGDPCRGVFKNLHVRYKMSGWIDDHIVETYGKGLRSSLRIGWAGPMLVSPSPQDIPLKKSTHQAWSTRWSGEFSGASRAEAQKVHDVKQRWKDSALKALTYQKMREAALSAAVGKKKAHDKFSEGKHSSAHIKKKTDIDAETHQGRVSNKSN